MKILIIDNQPIRRGAQLFAQDFKEELIKRNIPVRRFFLFSPSDKKWMLNCDEHDFIPPDGVKSTSIEKFLFWQPQILQSLINEIKNFQPDVILANGGTARMYAAYAKKRLRKKKICFLLTTRIIDSITFYRKFPFKQWIIKKIILPEVDGAIGVGDNALKQYSEVYHYSKPGTSIPRAFRVGRFTNNEPKEAVKERMKITKNKKIILFLGNITRQKRPDRFLRVFEKVHAQMPDTLAWMVGDGDLKKETQALAQNFGISNSVKLWGYQQNVEPFITASDLLFISSDTEGVPGIALEALYLEKPVVTTNAGDVAMVVQDGISGYVCGLDEEDKQAEKILTLLQDEKKARMMGRKGKKHISDNFNLSHITDRYLGFFEEVLKSKRVE